MQKTNHEWTQMDTDSRTEAGAKPDFIRVYLCLSVVEIVLFFSAVGWRQNSLGSRGAFCLIGRAE
jgi:hypothetical protein